jgi:hypothetical protein
MSTMLTVDERLLHLEAVQDAVLLDEDAYPPADATDEDDWRHAAPGVD